MTRKKIWKRGRAPDMKERQSAHYAVLFWLVLCCLVLFCFVLRCFVVDFVVLGFVLFCSVLLCIVFSLFWFVLCLLSSSFLLCCSSGHYAVLFCFVLCWLCLVLFALFFFSCLCCVILFCFALFCFTLHCVCFVVVLFGFVFFLFFFYSVLFVFLVLFCFVLFFSFFVFVLFWLNLCCSDSFGVVLALSCFVCVVLFCLCGVLFWCALVCFIVRCFVLSSIPIAILHRDTMVLQRHGPLLSCRSHTQESLWPRREGPERPPPTNRCR